MLRSLRDSGDFVCAVWLNKPGATWDSALCVLCWQSVWQMRSQFEINVVPTRGNCLLKRWGGRISEGKIHLDWVKPHDLPVISSHRTQFAIALTVELVKADFRRWDDGCGVHAQDRCRGGGARLGLQAGSSCNNFFIGSPQHGQATTRGGFSGATFAGPMYKTRPVWKAMRSCLILEAGWQKPK